jgi:hypothetical protein
LFNTSSAPFTVKQLRTRITPLGFEFCITSNDEGSTITIGKHKWSTASSSSIHCYVDHDRWNLMSLTNHLHGALNITTSIVTVQNRVCTQFCRKFMAKSCKIAAAGRRSILDFLGVWKQ